MHEFIVTYNSRCPPCLPLLLMWEATYKRKAVKPILEARSRTMSPSRRISGSLSNDTRPCSAHYRRNFRKSRRCLRSFLQISAMYMFRFTLSCMSLRRSSTPSSCPSLLYRFVDCCVSWFVPRRIAQRQKNCPWATMRAATAPLPCRMRWTKHLNRHTRALSLSPSFASAYRSPELFLRIMRMAS
jgi:hypothetical protein